MFGYIPDAFSNDLPELPSESANRARSLANTSAGGGGGVENAFAGSEGDSAGVSSTAGSSRSHSPNPETAGDSSQMRDALWSPPSPPGGGCEVEEELCVEKIITKLPAATPFFDAGSKILIKGGQVVNDDETLDATDVLIEDGVITKVGENIEVDSDWKVIDATGKTVMPGGIDPSVRLHSGKADAIKVADDFAVGSRAALAGGTTMIVELVDPGCEQSMLEALSEWKEDAEENCACDYAFKVAINNWNDAVREDMAQLVKQEGINAFKVSMADKEKMLKPNDMLDAFTACRELGAVVGVHAENGAVIAENEKRLLARGVTGPEGHLMARPEEIEESAVLTAISMARQANVPLVINGPTSARTAAVIGREKAKGQVVLGEATAAALALDGSHCYKSCWTHAASFVTSPPLRDDPSTPEKLVSALISGDLHMVASDNRGYTTEMKAASGGQNNFTAIPRGLNGIEDRMSVVWEKGVEAGKMEMEQFVSVTSANAAKSLNVYPRKGRIAEGSDADIVIWNRNNLRDISSKTHHHGSNFNVFEGLKVHGAPEHVISAGKFAVYEYQVSSSLNCGRKIDLPAYPPTLYDAMDDFAKMTATNGVARQTAEITQVERKISSASDFGVTTPRRALEQDPVMNKRLGVYQRPMSAHGVRHQQDSTFSLSGGTPADANRRASVKINAPPGGGGRDNFWG
jgi:D-hydantoinase